MKDIMIKVENLSKIYRLGQIGGTTLREEIQRWNARRKEKEDPTKKIDDYNFEYGKKFIALNNVSFEIRKGERIGIIGHNGAGKSTLLKLISRITSPTYGDIWLNGRVASMLEVGTGFHNELTGRENIFMNGAILGMRKREIQKKMEDIIDFSECRKFIDTPVKRYSSGMYVKLAFSVAAHLDSEIMIMDEVLAVGDIAFQKKCLEKMLQVSSEEGRTILYVSHNMNTIRLLCNRCIVLDNGSIVYDGSVEKGISLYLKNNTSFEYEKDLLSYPRLSYLKKDYIRFSKAKYVGKKDNIFQRNHHLVLELQYHFNENIDDVGFRLVVYDSLGSHICAAFCYHFCYGTKDDNNIAVIELDISNIAPGDYQSYYVFFAINEFGGTEDIDQVRGLDFTVEDNHGVEKLEWRKDAWGNFELPSPQIIEMRKI